MPEPGSRPVPLEAHTAIVSPGIRRVATAVAAVPLFLAGIGIAGKAPTASAETGSNSHPAATTYRANNETLECPGNKMEVTQGPATIVVNGKYGEAVGRLRVMGGFGGNGKPRMAVGLFDGIVSGESIDTQHSSAVLRDPIDQRGKNSVVVLIDEQPNGSLLVRC